MVSHAFTKMSANAPEEPHESGLVSLMYSTASNFLSNVVAIQESSPSKSLPDQESTPNESRKSIFSEADLQGLEFLNSVEDEKVEEASLYTPTGKKDEIEYSDPVLDHNMILQLKPHFPLIARESTELVMLFSIDRNGISMRTLYESTVNSGPCLIAVKDTNGYIFGCYINESLQCSTHYYGTGESFFGAN